MAHGTSGNDFIHATSDGLVAPGGSNDLIMATTKADFLAGWGGDDTINGGGGADSLYGGAGNDLLVTDEGGVNIPAGRVFDGGDGIDVIFGTSVEFRSSLGTIHGVEQIRGFAGGLSLSKGQLTGLTSIDTGEISLFGSGVIDLTDIAIRAPVLRLDGQNAVMLTLSAGQLDAATGTFAVFEGR